MVVVLEGVDLTLQTAHLQTYHLCGLDAAGGTDTVDLETAVFHPIAKLFHLKICALKQREFRLTCKADVSVRLDYRSFELYRSTRNVDRHDSRIGRRRNRRLQTVLSGLHGQSIPTIILVELKGRCVQSNTAKLYTAVLSHGKAALRSGPDRRDGGGQRCRRGENISIVLFLEIASHHRYRLTIQLYCQIICAVTFNRNRLVTAASVLENAQAFCRNTHRCKLVIGREAILIHRTKSTESPKCGSVHFGSLLAHQGQRGLQGHISR